MEEEQRRHLLKLLHPRLHQTAKGMQGHQQVILVQATVQTGTMAGAGKLGPRVVGDMGMGQPIPLLVPLRGLDSGLDQGLVLDQGLARDGDMDLEMELLDTGMARADHMAREEVMEAPNQVRNYGDQGNYLVPAMPLSWP